MEPVADIVNRSEPRFALDKLVPVVWELISRHLNGYDIMALLRTNSRGIVWRWRQIKLRDFDLVSTSSARWDGSAFGSLQHLSHLQSIKIHNSSLKVLEQGPKMLHYLPSQILKLSINLPSRLEDWLIIKYNNKGADERAATLDESGSPMQVDLGSLFPELQELEIAASAPRHPIVRSMVKSSKPQSSLKIQVLHERAGVKALVFFYTHLPSKRLKLLHMPTIWTRAEDLESLVHREANAHHSSSSSSSSNSHSTTSVYDVYSSLPSTLETLITSMDRDPVEYTRRAEAAQRYLESDPLPPTIFATLPRSLTSLSVTAARLSIILAHRSIFLAPISEMKSLSFLSLNLGQHFQIATELFTPLSPSPSLTTSGRDLTIPCVISSLKLVFEYERLLPINIFDALPKTLEELQVDLVDTPFSRGTNAMSIGSQLPKKLKSFKFTTTKAIGDPVYPIFGLDQMPSELIELQWGEGCRVTNQQVRDLPSSLKTLRLDFSPLSFEVHPANCDCEQHYADDNDYDYNDYPLPRTPYPDEKLLERHLSDGASLYLPPHLSTLELRHSSFGSLFFVNLPSSITDLSAVTDRPLESPDLFLSSALSSLFLDAPLLSLHSLASLPSTLTSLHLIEPCSSPNFDKSKITLPIDHYTFADLYMAILPPSISNLTIIGARNVTDEAQWPSSLTRLVLSASCFLSDQSLARFPKSLRSLQVQRMVIAPHTCRPRAEIIRDAPPFLPAHTLPWMTLRNRNVDFSSLP